jgi:hypothetical protein
MGVRFEGGDAYPHVCSHCRSAIDQAKQLFDDGVMEDTDDPEAPCNLVHDNGLFCGDSECVNSGGDAR